jgi:hypothetical protein
MNTPKLWMCVVLALLAAPALAAARKVVETSTSAIVMPSTPDGTLVLKPCNTCPPVSVRVTPQSRYFLSNQEVTLQELIVQAKNSGPLSLVISYDPKTLELHAIRGRL